MKTPIKSQIIAGKEIKYELIDANNIQKDSFINIKQNELKIIRYN